MDFYLTELVSPYPAATGALFSTFTTRQDVSPQPLPTINGYKLRIGSKIVMEAEGEYSSLTGAVLTLGFYIGTVAGAITTVISEAGAQTAGTTPAAWPWHMEWRGIVTATGVSGSLTGSGRLDFGTSLTAFAQSAMPVSQALRTFTWDTTIPRAIGVCATYGASSASNQVKTNLLNVALLN